MTSKHARSGYGRAAIRSTQPRKDAGAAAVEFVLVLPILLALVFGIIYFGYIFSTQISLNSSARDAARAGVVKPLASTGGSALTCSQIATNARAGAATIGVVPNDIVVTVTSLTTTTSCTLLKGGTVAAANGGVFLCAGTSGQLQVKLNYIMVSPVPLVPLSSVSLKATGAFQCEYN